MWIANLTPDPIIIEFFDQNDPICAVPLTFGGMGENHPEKHFNIPPPHDRVRLGIKYDLGNGKSKPMHDPIYIVTDNIKITIRPGEELEFEGEPYPFTVPLQQAPQGSGPGPGIDPSTIGVVPERPDFEINRRIDDAKGLATENTKVDHRNARDEYIIGCGIADITDYAVGSGLQGFSNTDQKSERVETPLYARAFIIAEPNVPDKSVVLVVCDMWSCSFALKRAVIERLAAGPLGAAYRDQNVWITGTHTHSGPGGFLEHHLYNYGCGGFDAHAFESYVAGIVRAIQRAHLNLAAGRIYINTGIVPDCGRNRSAPAYMRNPDQERAAYPTDTDKEMLLLKFVELRNGVEYPVGLLNWYAVHPTSRGQNNKAITGDTKGFASLLCERAINDGGHRDKYFVAAFANANCGDVSGNVEYGTWPSGSDDRARMEDHGNRQFQVAKAIFDLATTRLAGPIDYRLTYRNMHLATGRIGAVGLSVFAGSTEDGDPSSGLREGITIMTGEDIPNALTWLEPLVQGAVGTIFTTIAGPVAAIRGFPTITIPTALSATRDEHRGHAPKPIVMLTSGARPVPVTPITLPFQMLRLGQLAVLGHAGEITTMAGRRIRADMLQELRPAGVSHVAVGTYANGYAGYVTTQEEYGAQHYEGASTLYGPGTLDAIRAVFRELARAVRDGGAINSAPPPPNIISQIPRRNRVTIRNLSSETRLIHFYRPEHTLGGGIAEKAIAVVPLGELGWTMPDAWQSTNVNCPAGDQLTFMGGLFQIYGRVPTVNVPRGALLTIGPGGAMSVTQYEARADVIGDEPGRPRMPDYRGVIEATGRPAPSTPPIRIQNATPFPIEIMAFNPSDDETAFLASAVPGSVQTVPANATGSWEPPENRPFKIRVDRRHTLMGAPGQELVFNVEDWITVRNETDQRLNLAFFGALDPIVRSLSQPFFGSEQYLEPRASVNWKAPVDVERVRLKVYGREPIDCYRNTVVPITADNLVRVRNASASAIQVRFYQAHDSGEGLAIPWDARSHFVQPGNTLMWEIPDGRPSTRIRIKNLSGIVTERGQMLTFEPDGQIARG